MAKSRIAGITIEIGGDTTGLQNALKGTNDNIKKTQDELKDVTRLLKLDPTNTELLKQKQVLLNKAIDETKQKLQMLQNAQRQAASEVGQNGKITQEQYRALQREVEATKEEIKKLQKEANSANAALQKVSDVTGKIGKTATKIGKGMSVVSAGIGGVATAAVKTTADFESAMSNVQAISGATGEDMNSLKEKAREMGAQTKFSATEAGEAMSYMAMAGWKTEEMMSGISGIMNLAAASGEDLATTSDIVTDALTAFGLTAQDTEKFVDTLAATATNSNTNVSLLGESFKYCAPVCGALGYSAEDTSIALGLMANCGIKATNAGTALRAILTNMAKPTDAVEAAMSELGVSLTDSEGKMLSLRDLMVNLRDGFGQSEISAEELTESMNQLQTAYENGETTADEYEEAQKKLIESAYGAEGAEKARLAAMLAGKEGMSGLLAIVNATEGDLDKLTTAIDNSKDSAQNMADIMNDNLKGQLTILKSQCQELAISIGELLMPQIRNIVGSVQGVVDKLNRMSDHQKKLIVDIALLIAAIGPLLLVIGKISAGISTVSAVAAKIMPFIGIFMNKCSMLPGIFMKIITASKGIAQSISLMLGPVGMIVAAIVAVIAILVGLYTKCDDFRNFVNNTLLGMFTFIQQIISELIAVIQEFWEWLEPYVSPHIEFLKGILILAIEGIKAFIELFLLNIVTSIKAVLIVIQNVVELVLGVIKSVVSGAMDFIQGIIDVVLGVISGDWERVWTGIKEMLGGIVEAIGGIIGNLVSFLTNTFEDLINLGFEWGKDFVSGLAKGIKSMIDSVGDAAKSIANKITNILHFSRPDEGPLRDYETWMPDFVGRMAEQIKQQEYKIAQAAMGLAQSLNISADLPGNNPKGGDNTQINFNGNYNFRNRDDVDYFMNQAALRLAVSR
ncbi:phage tail tape measure protein [Lachnospira intestinalis]|uniref:Phage tail tape measure protein n=1 Tax=Lachnospira intestinalis TaxID=3133158 RepID=A0ABV1H671_9FIRM